MNQEEKIQDIMSFYRNELLKKINELDADLVGELSINFKSEENKFSNWRDRFKDGPRFRDTFGRAGNKESIQQLEDE